MGRKKTAKSCNILPWLSAKVDCREGRFIQVGNSFLLSAKVHALTPNAKFLYFAMCMEAGGKREVIFTHGAARKYGISGTTFDRATKQLIELGFIDKIESEELLQYAPGKYRFSDCWKLKPAPQNGEG